jgi:hypothetical protein
MHHTLFQQKVVRESLCGVFKEARKKQRYGKPLEKWKL